MDVVRGFIKISGITSESELLYLKCGSVFRFAEKDTIHIPDGISGMDSIYEIILKPEISGFRMIHTPAGNSVVMDGTIRLKVIYTETNGAGKANILNLELPFNTFFGLPQSVEFTEACDLYIIDAFFSLIDSRRIYSYIVYMVHIANDAPAAPVKKINTEHSFCHRIISHESQERQSVSETTKTTSVPVAVPVNSDQAIPTQDVYTKAVLVDIDSEYL